MFFNKMPTLIIDTSVAGGDQLKQHYAHQLASDWARTIDFNFLFLIYTWLMIR